MNTENNIEPVKAGVKPYMFWIAFVSVLGGLLFGFDTAVISGAERQIQEVYGLSGFAHGFTMATALIGTIIGALFCGKPADCFGRKPTLIAVALLYLISAVFSGAIVNWYSFMFFRFIGGLAVGASSVVGPMYIAETSPAKWRGRFVCFFQFNIVLGIVLAYLSNYFIAGVPNDWQWMIIAESVPALFFCVLMFTVPESPRWLISKGRECAAREVFVKTGEPDADNEIISIRKTIAEVSSGVKSHIFKKKYWKPVLIAFLIATFNQLSGINAILYYAPRLLEQSGIFSDGALLQSVIIGITNLTFSMVGLLLIDKFGRRKLIGAGALGMVFCQAMVARGFATGAFQGYYMLIFLMGYVAFFAMSLGATIWVVIAEVFPQEVRAGGQVFGSMTHWFWSALLTWMFPVVLTSNRGAMWIFIFFSLIAFLSLFFAIWLPETKGKSLEDIRKEMIKE